MPYEVLALDLLPDVELAGTKAGFETTDKLTLSNDLLIAAHANALDAVLVTANVREFSQIRAPKVENWLA